MKKQKEETVDMTDLSNKEARYIATFERREYVCGLHKWQFLIRCESVSCLRRF